MSGSITVLAHIDMPKADAFVTTAGAVSLACLHDCMGSSPILTVHLQGKCGWQVHSAVRGYACLQLYSCGCLLTGKSKLDMLLFKKRQTMYSYLNTALRMHMQLVVSPDTWLPGEDSKHIRCESVWQRCKP